MTDSFGLRFAPDLDVTLPPPAPLSFPALLQDPHNRFTHLHGSGKTGGRKEGKRKALRKENSRFSFNPHIVTPQRSDFDPNIPEMRSTFPVPLPPYLPRSSLAPSLPLPQRDESSADAGRFGVSLRGVRRILRRKGFWAEKLVRVIEDELVKWVESQSNQLYPDRPLGPSVGIPIDSSHNSCLGGMIIEVYRTPLKLVWKTGDATARYVVHCAARWHNIVSFSQDQPSGERITSLLRPNVALPDYRGLASLDTPPITDVTDAYSSAVIDTDDSDAASSVFDPSPRERIQGYQGLHSLAEEAAIGESESLDSPMDYSSSDDSLFLASTGVISEDEDIPTRDLQDLALCATTSPARLARSLDRIHLQGRAALRSHSSPSPSPLRQTPRAPPANRLPRQRGSSPVGRGILPHLPIRSGGRSSVRAQSLADYVFA